MRIEIDTKHDSPEEIRKAIQLLQLLTQGTQQSVANPVNDVMQQLQQPVQQAQPQPQMQTFGQTQQPAQQQTQPVSGGIFDIFTDTPSQTQQSSQQEQQTQPDDSVKIIQY